VTPAELAHIAAANGLLLDDRQLTLLGRYAALLREQNQHVNLISRKDEENILEKHILHSLTIAMPTVSAFTIPDGARVFDVGSGGGLPGVPLSIVRPDLAVVVCDSIAKKISAVNEIIDGLRLPNINAISGRAEDVAKLPEHRQRYDVIVSRAVAPLYDLVAWTRGLMKAGGTLVSLKGGDLTVEIAHTQKKHEVAEVSERLLDLKEYHHFVSDEKKIVRVLLR
jgi:16S rRNA (guanine527-N7)-methyltransferase